LVLIRCVSSCRKNEEQPIHLLYDFQIRVSNDDKPLFSVCNVEETVPASEGLLFISGQLLTQRSTPKRGGEATASAFYGNVKALADGRKP